MSTRPHSGGPALDPRITEAVTYYLATHKAGGKRAPYFALKDTANKFDVKVTSICSRLCRMKT